MEPLNFIEKHGKELAEKVAKAAGTNWAYFSQIAYGHRRPSVELAERLVAESAKEVPVVEEQLDFTSLMKSKGKAAA
jgi:hypothetical protein